MLGVQSDYNTEPNKLGKVESKEFKSLAGAIIFSGPENRIK